MDDSIGESRERRMTRYRRSTRAWAWGVLAFGLLMAALAVADHLSPMHPPPPGHAWDGVVIFGIAAMLMLAVSAYLFKDLGERKPFAPGEWVMAPVRQAGSTEGLRDVAAGSAASLALAAIVAAAWPYLPGPAYKIGDALLAGLALAGVAYVARETIGLARYGRVTLQCNDVTLGRELRVDVEIEKAAADLREIEVTLECRPTTFHLVSTRNGASLRGVYGQKTRVTKPFPVTRLGDGALCAIHLEFPAGAGPSDADEIFRQPARHAVLGVDYFQWTLAIRGAVAGADLRRTFPLAVQRA